MGQHEGEAGDSLNALVGRRDQVVRADVRHVQRDPAEGRHRVQDEDLAVPAATLPNFGRRVQDARRRLAVDQRHVRQLPVGQKLPLDPNRIDRLDFRKRQDGVRDPQSLGDSGDPVAVGPVVQDEQLAVRRHATAHGGLDGERAAALHQDRSPLGPAAGEVAQPAADAVDDLVILVVPGAIVAQHRLFHRARRRKRSGGQQQVRDVVVHVHGPEERERG